MSSCKEGLTWAATDHVEDIGGEATRLHDDAFLAGLVCQSHEARITQVTSRDNARMALAYLDMPPEREAGAWEVVEEALAACARPTLIFLAMHDHMTPAGPCRMGGPASVA